MLSFLVKYRPINTSTFPWTYSVASKLIMSESVSDNNVGSLKREAPSELCDNEQLAKRALLIKQERVKKKKVAMLIAYSGQGYLGLQRNPGTKTVEEDLLVALLKAGYINEEVYNQPQLIQFQRAARTDKGVSALRQTLSMKMPENCCTTAINEHLPEQIRAIALKRVTKGFNSKSSCDARTYSYTTPTYAFCPPEDDVSESFRLSQSIHDRINDVLKMFEGTHNYHNFTCRKMSTDPSAQRFIISFACGEPFVIDGLEFVALKVKGQSFMQHQIRKMVGLVIAIMQKFTTTDTLIRSWAGDKLDLPIAPGLGLLLEEVHYDRYNQRYGTDGMHETIEWSKWEKEIEDFRYKFILPTIVQTERNEKSMLSWLQSLHLHSFDLRTDHIHQELDEALEKGQGLLSPPSKLDALIAAAQAVETA